MLEIKYVYDINDMELIYSYLSKFDYNGLLYERIVAYIFKKIHILDICDILKIENELMNIFEYDDKNIEYLKDIKEIKEMNKDTFKEKIEKNELIIDFCEDPNYPSIDMMFNFICVQITKSLNHNFSPSISYMSNELFKKFNKSKYKNNIIVIGPHEISNYTLNAVEIKEIDKIPEFMKMDDTTVKNKIYGNTGYICMSLKRIKILLEFLKNKK